MSTYKWNLKITKKAQKAFDSLDSAYKKAVFEKLSRLLACDNPCLDSHVAKLEMYPFYRIRVRDIRIIFDIIPGKIVKYGFTYKGEIVIMEICDRKNAYDGH